MPTDPIAGTTDDRATVFASEAKPPTDDDLGMRLSPGVEDEARRARWAAAGDTIVWPPPPESESGCWPHVRPDDLNFGKYELIGEIGRGGMGVVYKARQKDLDRVVAIKMILASHLASPEQVGRFYAEARAAARLHDPHIVGIHDVGEIHGQHYFAMEYVAGPSLAQVLDGGPLDPKEAARIVLGVAKAVGHLHRQGVVHRDLKPSNILLDPQGRPRVTDFGLAKMLQSDGPMTHSGAIVGTPNYMSPEQAAGRGAEVGPLSDVYSLGAILYELLTGRPPFNEPTPLDTLVQVLEGEPPRPRTVNAAVPKALETICLKCLEKAPDARYGSAAALAEDLDHFLRGEPIEARRMGLWTRLRRWSRREPALVSRLSTLAICGSIIQADRFLREGLDRAPHRRIMAVLAAGAVLSLLFQWVLRSERWSSLARYAWALTDVALFTTLVVVNNALTTPLVAGYFLLVTASGLWFRERLVWFTSTLAVLAYVGLVGWAARSGAPAWESRHLHLLFTTVLAVSGVIVGYQVRRVRALSQYYEHRPLP